MGLAGAPADSLEMVLPDWAAEPYLPAVLTVVAAEMLGAESPDPGVVPCDPVVCALTCGCAAAWAALQVPVTNDWTQLASSLVAGRFRTSRVWDDRYGLLLGSELLHELAMRPAAVWVVWQRGVAHVVAPAVTPDAHQWLQDRLGTSHAARLRAVQDVARKLLTAGHSTATTVEAGVLGPCHLWLGGPAPPGWQPEVAEAAWLPAEWAHLPAARDASGFSAWEAPPLPSSSRLQAVLFSDLDATRRAQLRLWSVGCAAVRSRLVTHGVATVAAVVRDTVARVRERVPDAVLSNDLWGNVAWAGLLLAPGLVAALRDADAAADEREFTLASYASRVARVAEIHGFSRRCGYGGLSSALELRRYRRAREGGGEVVEQSERPRSDAAAEMVALGCALIPPRVLASWEAQLPLNVMVALGTMAKSHLQPAAYLRLHAESHGCGDASACAHARTVLSFALDAHLARNGAAEEEVAMRGEGGAPPDPASAAVLDAKVAEAVASGALQAVVGPAAAPAAPRVVARVFTAWSTRLAGGPVLAAAVAAAATGDASPLWAAADAEAASLLKEVAVELSMTAGGARAGATAFKRAWQSRMDAAKMRMVYDGRGPSSLLLSTPFAMGGVGDVLRSVRPGDWIAAVDLKGGFHHVVVHDADRALLGTRWRGVTYRWCRLPFGINQAPFIFCLLTAELTYLLRCRGVVVAVTYVDDLILVGRSRVALEDALRMVQSLCAELGLDLAPEKTRPPAQRQVVLGHEVDTTGARVRVSVTPARAATNALAVAVMDALLRRDGTVPPGVCGWAPTDWVRTVIGRWGAQAAITPAAAAFMQPAYWLARQAEGDEPMVRLWAARELQQTLGFWRSQRGTAGHLGGFMPPHGGPEPGNAATISSDASGDPTGTRGGSAFGGWRAGVAIWGTFPTEAASEESSTLLEARAALASLVQFASEGESLYVCTDSQALAHSLNAGRAGGAGGRSGIADVVKQFYLHMDAVDCDVVAVCVPRQLMSVCDVLSKANTLEQARASVASHFARCGTAAPVVVRAPVFGAGAEVSCSGGHGGVGGGGAGLERFRLRVLHRCNPTCCIPTCPYHDGSDDTGAPGGGTASGGGT